MDEFTQALSGWQLFYATVATSAATLTGLLFVALSINLEKLKGADGARRLRVARRSFGDFLYTLMIGLVFLVPNQVPAGFSLALLVLAASRAAGVVRQAAKGRRGGRQGSGAVQAIREYALPLIASLGLAAVAVAALTGFYGALYGLVGVIAALLATASWNAWILLVQEIEPPQTARSAAEGAENARQKH
jgi:hypothetical protein